VSAEDRFAAANVNMSFAVELSPPRQGGEIPVRGGTAGPIVPTYEVIPHPWRKRHGGVGHSQRLQDAIGYESLVRCSGAQRECMTQQGDADVGVLDSVTRIARKLVGRKKLVHPAHGVAHVRILVHFHRCTIRRVHRQAGKVGGEIEQCNGLPVSFGNANVARQQVRNGIGKVNLASSHHVCQQDSGEHLRHGTDLEHALTVERTRAGTRIAMRDHPPSPIFVQQAHDDAPDSMAVHELLEQYLHLRVRWEWRLRRSWRCHKSESADDRGKGRRHGCAPEQSQGMKEWESSHR